MSEVRVLVVGGGTLDSIEFDPEDIYPTEGDLLFAAQLQRSMILARTDSGVDVDGQPFAAYNSTRPYYYYASGAVGKRRTKQELGRAKAGVTRFARKVGRTKGARTPSGLGLRFDSYRSFKMQYLGRSVVDLRGPRAPHMLQEILVKAGGSAGNLQDQPVGLDDMPTRADEFVLGIYGDAGLRASGINAESGRPKGMPRRHFFGSSEDDNNRLVRAIVRRRRERIQEKIRGG